MGEPVADGETTALDVVVIVDDSEGRRKNMAEAFGGQAARVLIAYKKSKRTYFIEGTNPANAPDPALLILRHFSNLDVAPGIKAALTIYFGGSGGEDPKAPPDAHHRIWRHVSAEGGNLSPKEAGDLLEYARRIKAGAVDAPKPNILKDPRTVFILPALSIMCQGYLAAYARRDSTGGWGPPDIKGAIRHMGLLELLEGGGENAKLIEEILPGKRDAVTSPRWWLSVLGESKESVEKQVVAELDLKSIYDCRPVHEFIDALYAGGAARLQPAVVADAYCAIAAKLTGRLCEQE